MIGKIKRIILLIIIGILILPIHYSNVGIVLADSNAYYVANDGDNSNDGLSPDTPWRTIGKVTSELNGGVIAQGDDVYFKRGDTFTDAELILRIGGTSSNWMEIGAYGSGAKPVFSGITGVQDGAIHLATSVSYIKIQDIDITNAEKVGIRLSQSGITNMTVYNVIISNSGSNGIVITGCDHLIMENLTVSNPSGAGIVIYGRDTGTQNRNTKALNCTVSTCSADGFTYHQSDGLGTNIGANHYLYNCIGHGTTVEQGFDITSGTDIYIKDCEAYENNNGGMVIGHDTERVTVDNLYLHDEDDEGLIFSSTDDCRVRNSIIHDINSYGFDHTIALNVIGLNIYNNDFILESGNGKAVRFATGDMSDIIVKNNIFYVNDTAWASRYIHVNNLLSAIPMNSSYNMFYRNGDSNTTDRFIVNALNRNWNEWIAYAETWQDKNWLDPLISDIGNEDFSLSWNSPAIDGGDWLTATNGGGSGTTITLLDSNYFFPGLPTLGVSGDNIFVGSNTNLEVIAVDYSAETITVNRSITWSDGDDASLSSYNGSAPDIGAYESQSIGQLPSFPVISNILRAESDPLDTEASFGWINITATVTSDSGVNIVMCDVSLPNGSNTNVSMIQIGSNTYYHNTSTIFSTHGSHSYFIWANDTYGNATISSSYDFSMSPNWDITGSPGWIREDVDNNGIIDVFDFVQVSQHYFETW